MARENTIKMIQYAMDKNYVDFQKEVRNELNSRICEYSKNLKNEIINKMNGVETEPKKELKEEILPPKLPATKWVLQQMDSYEDGEHRYEEFVKKAVKKFNIDRKKLEDDLNYYI